MRADTSVKGGLFARVLALSLGLVLLTTLAAGVATIQTARQSARTEQRTELAAQASLVTLQSARLVTARQLRRVESGLDGSVLTVYDGDGAVLVSTAPGRPRLLAATAAAGRRAVAGQDVSTEVRVGPRDHLVEARPTADGGAIVLSRPLRLLTPVTEGLVARILLVLLIATVVAVAAAIWLSRRIARPLTATAAAARRLARGERGVPFPASGPGEVGAVAAALEALDLALVRSEGRQREFLLSISHELRTPLTALRGYGEALADGLIDADRTREVGRTLVAETTRVERFTADLLELARLEAEDFSIALVDVDLAEVVGAAATAWRAQAEVLGVDLRVEGFDTAVPVRADPRRLRQILDGLVENAVRATPPGGSITFVAVLEEAGRGVAVEDTGPGLSEEDLADAFTRGLLRERYRTSREVGTGLGLSIAARLTARMGGRISAERGRQHPGARFVVRFPNA